MWCVAELNPEYIEKMEDVLATYEKPYTGCGNRWSAWTRSRSRCTPTFGLRFPLPPAGRRNGTTSTNDAATANVFCAVEPKAGRHFTLPTSNRSAAEFAQALETIVRSYPGVRKIHLVMDNLNIHGRKSLTDYFGEERGGSIWNRSRSITRPSMGSWLNQAEIEISLFSRQCLGKRRIPHVEHLAPGVPRLEPPSQPASGQDQLAVYPVRGHAAKFGYKGIYLGGHRTSVVSVACSK